MTARPDVNEVTQFTVMVNCCCRIDDAMRAQTSPRLDHSARENDCAGAQLTGPANTGAGVNDCNPSNGGKATGDLAADKIVSNSNHESFLPARGQICHLAQYRNTFNLLPMLFRFVVEKPLNGEASLTQCSYHNLGVAPGANYENLLRAHAIFPYGCLP